MRKAFHIKYLERPNESKILSRALAISNIVAITGLEGAGKTSLVAEVLKNNGTSAKWYTLSNFLTLSALLGFPNLSSEEALQRTLVSLQNTDTLLVVWDNLHFLNFQNQQMLIYSLIHSKSDQAHIFISDEKIELPSDVPQITIGGLTSEEIKSFLNLFEVAIEDNQINEVFSLTGGLPLLLKQWTINPSINSFEKSLQKNLTKDQLQLLKILSFSRTPLTIHDLSDAETTLTELQKKNLIETTHNNQIQVPLFIKKIFYASASKDEHALISKIIYKALSKKEEIENVVKVIVALEAHDFAAARRHSLQVELDDLEQLTSENIQLLTQSLQTSVQLDFSLSENSKLTRLLIHSLILSNKRSEAIETALNILESFDWKTDFNVEKQWLAYDLIYWLDRSQHSVSMQKPISLFINQSKPPLSYLFQIELNFVLTQNPESTQAARTNLIRILHEINKHPQPSSVTSLAAANANYQLGINYMLTNESPLGVRHFSEAKKLFKEIKRTYFELFCEFNICLILFYGDEPLDLQQKLLDLKKKATFNGYTYLLAGTDLLSAHLAYNNLESSKALSYIEESYSKIDAGMPLNSKIDIISTKVRILKDLGLEDSALKACEELRKLLPHSEKSMLKRLALETQIDFIPLAEIEESWKSFEQKTERSEELSIYLLQRGIKDSTQKIRPSLRNQLANTECELIAAIRNANTALIEDQLRQIENLLKRTSEDRIERIALWCLTASLSKEKRTSLLEKVELYIKKISVAESTRNFFSSWLRSLKKDIFIKEVPEFSTVHQQDLERWSLWLLPQKKKKYTFYHNESVTETDELLPAPPKDGIYIIDNQKTVFVKGKRTAAFDKKPILIQLLVLLLTNSPEKLSKATLASTLWGDSYDPSIHDARIYTSIQRIRSILGEKYIENWDGGYRWSQKLPFYLFRSNETQGLKQNKIATVFIETLRKRRQNISDESLQWMTRKDLVEAGDTSDATAKRVLAELLKDHVIEKNGNGPSTVYRLVR